MLRSADRNKLLISNDLLYSRLTVSKMWARAAPESVGRHQEQFAIAYLSSKGQKGDRRQELSQAVGEGAELFWVVAVEEGSVT